MILSLRAHRLRIGLHVLALAIVGFVAAPGLAAQPETPCADTLQAAQDLYTRQDFDAAETLARTCLVRADVPPQTRVELWRLVALTHLRRADLAEARTAVFQLLGESPSYTADPVQDPPSYVALVGLVREQLGMVSVPEPSEPGPEDSVVVAAPDEPANPPDLTPPPPVAERRAAGVLSLHLSAGAGSYGGERGVNESSVVQDFTANDGLSFEVGAGYRPAAGLAVAATYRAARFARLLENDVRAGDLQVRPADSDAWVHFLTVAAQRTFGRDWRVAPFVRLGVTGSLGRLNDEVRIGVGPLAEVGLDVALTPGVGAFVALSSTVIYPGDAVDAVDYGSAFGDVLTFVGLGMRYRVAAR
jgi:hypothetical protein